MFSQQQIAHFHAFGSVVLPGLLDDGETAALTGEVTAALGDAFGGIGTDTDPEGIGGIRGDYLPLSVGRAPLSQSTHRRRSTPVPGRGRAAGRPDGAVSSRQVALEWLRPLGVLGAGDLR